MLYQSDYKSGDLVRHCAKWHDFGLGLLIRKTGRIDVWGFRYDPDEDFRWYVHWTNAPCNPEPIGYNIAYETEFIMVRSA